MCILIILWANRVSGRLFMCPIINLIRFFVRSSLLCQYFSVCLDLPVCNYSESRAEYFTKDSSFLFNFVLLKSTYIFIECESFARCLGPFWSFLIWLDVVAFIVYAQRFLQGDLFIIFKKFTFLKLPQLITRKNKIIKYLDQSNK